MTDGPIMTDDPWHIMDDWCSKRDGKVNAITAAALRARAREMG